MLIMSYYGAKIRVKRVNKSENLKSTEHPTSNQWKIKIFHFSQLFNVKISSVKVTMKFCGIIHSCNHIFLDFLFF
jgi:hypothetical protein